MAQAPRWFRKNLLEQKLSHVLNNPYADISAIQAAKKAIEIKLEQQDSQYEKYQQNKTQEYLKGL